MHDDPIFLVEKWLGSIMNTAEIKQALPGGVFTFQAPPDVKAVFAVVDLGIATPRKAFKSDVFWDVAINVTVNAPSANPEVIAKACSAISRAILDAPPTNLTGGGAFQGASRRQISSVFVQNRMVTVSTRTIPFNITVIPAN